MRVPARRTAAAVLATAAVATGCVALASGAPAAAPAAVAAAVNPVLQIGSKGPAVAQLQTQLGVFASGYFGVATQTAVTNFQRANAIPVTGVVAAQTWSALNRGSGSAAVANQAVAARTTLQLGMTSPAVMALQRALRMPVATGYFGTMTQAYVRELQAAAKIKVTGVVDERTWRKVGKVAFKPPVMPVAPTAPATPVGAPTAPATPAASASALAAAKDVGGSGLASRILAVAASQAGIPYVANGYSPQQGFNCSSYTQWVYQQAGIDLGGAYTVTQFNRASQKITSDQARPGDLVFFYNYPNNFLGHVGIYAGNGKIWHAPRTGKVVSLSPIYTAKVYYARVL